MKWWIAVIPKTVRSFFQDDCLNLAANISFYALFSIIPIGMLAVSLSGYFLGSSERVYEELVILITRIFPVGKDIFLANIQSVVTQKSSLGIVGVIFLFFVSTMLVSSIERSLDIIFASEKRRNFLHSHLLGVLLILLFVLLFSLPTVAKVMEGLLTQLGYDFHLTIYTSSKYFFFVTAFIAFILTVVIVPNHKVLMRYAVIGGLLFAPGIGIARLIFTWFMSLAVHRYNLIYGSLAALVMVIIWIYYLAVVLLVASELVSVLQERKRPKI